MPAAGDGSYSYEVAISCNTNATNRGRITFSQVNTNESTTLAIVVFGPDGQEGSYTFPTGTVNGTFTVNDLPNGEYSWEITPSPGTLVEGGNTIACTETPPPDPAPVETPGTATPPAAKYMAVGGTLSNPIEYAFAFQVNNAAGVPKTGHYVIVNIYREDETTPSATARARIRNGAAKVDVSRFVQSMLSITPPTGTDTIQADTGALVRYHIGFVEVWGAVVMDEVMVADRYAVNAALQSLVNDFTDHVIWPAL